MKKYFDFNHLRGDVFGGLSAGIVALPLAHAFGGTNTQISSPTAPMTAVSMLVIRMTKVPCLDQSGLYAMEDVLIDLANQGKTVIITGLQKQPRYMMERVDMIPNLVAGN